MVDVLIILNLALRLNMRYKYSKKEEREIKKILPKEVPLTKDYEEYIDYFLSLTEQQILDDYSSKFNKGNFYEMIMTQAEHIELLLKVAILLNTKKFSKGELDKYSFFDVINLAFLTKTIPDYFAKHYHDFRKIRNECAHDLFFNIKNQRNDFIDCFGKGSCYIFEIIDIIRKMMSI